MSSMDSVIEADTGGEVGDRDDPGHLLDPRMRCISLARVLAVLRARGDALAVALHPGHVRIREIVVRVPGALLAEIIRPGGEVFRGPGERYAARTSLPSSRTCLTVTGNLTVTAASCALSPWC